MFSHFSLMNFMNNFPWFFLRNSLRCLFAQLSRHSLSSSCVFRSKFDDGINKSSDIGKTTEICQLKWTNLNYFLGNVKSRNWWIMIIILMTRLVVIIVKHLCVPYTKFHSQKISIFIHQSARKSERGAEMFFGSTIKICEIELAHEYSHDM